MKPLLLTNALIINEDLRYPADILIDKGTDPENCLAYSLPNGMAGY